jgi:nucleoside-triphosphatase
MKKNILITGMPQSGKSTLLKKLIASFPNRKGLITNEMRDNSGARTGFEMEASSGVHSVLASIHFDEPIKVSKYGVRPDSISMITYEINSFKEEDLLFIDEIGEMQLYSESFKSLVISYLDAPNTCIATISKIYNNPFTKSLRLRDDIIVIDLSYLEREKAEAYILALASKIEKAKRYIVDPDRFIIGRHDSSIRTDHGIRNLTVIDDEWYCECDFFKKNYICSHTIALEEYLNRL